MNIPQPSSGAILCFGEMLLRLGGRPGSLLSEAQDLAVHVAGAEANVAVALAQLGHPVEMVTMLPQGPLGDLAERSLRRHGVGVGAIRRGDGRIGLYFLEPGAGRRPSRIVYDRAGSLFSSGADAFEWAALVAGAGWLHMSGITAALGDTGAAAVAAAATAARAAGVTVSFDCNYRPSLWQGREEQAPALLAGIVAQADVLFGSARDIQLLTGRPVADAPDPRTTADVAFAAFPTLRAFFSTLRLIEDDGGQALSARLDLPDGGVEAEAVRSSGIVDRIGSGDAFVAGAIDGMARGLSGEQIVARGLAAASLKLTIAGDQWLGSSRDLDEFEQFRGSDVRR
jgi:2-dehydro-3-deoxygluconokinase